MIVECEKCSSTFNLDDTLIQETGSKVRCSVCKHTFMVLPPNKDDEIDLGMEETAPLDSPPVLDEEEDSKPEADDIFDKAFEEALGEDIEEEAVEEVEEPGPQIESKSPAEKRGEKGPRSLLIILIIILVLISGAIFVYFFAPSILPDSLSGVHLADKTEITDTGSKRLEIADYKGNYLLTGKSGQLYIITGNIINKYSTSRSHILLKGIIEDENKKPIKSKLAYAGNTFSEHELKGMTREEIEKSMANKAGKNNSNLNVEPNTSVPFMIIFFNLPDNISDFFVVETIRSSLAN
ncbi:DUF3426 domain-containing protein [Thermodesulfobacteriota bacterium]